MLLAVSSKKGAKPCCPCPESSPIPLEIVLAAGTGQQWSKCLPGRQHGLNAVIMVPVWEEWLPTSSCLRGKTALRGSHQQSSAGWFCEVFQQFEVVAVHLHGNGRVFCNEPEGLLQDNISIQPMQFSFAKKGRDCVAIGEAVESGEGCRLFLSKG